MGKVAIHSIHWTSEPKFDEDGNVVLKKIAGVALEEPDIVRVHVLMDTVVPPTVPAEVVAEWEVRGLVRDDPSREWTAPKTPEPPMRTFASAMRAPAQVQAPKGAKIQKGK
jgi:hypothetical protein